MKLFVEVKNWAIWTLVGILSCLGCIDLYYMYKDYTDNTYTVTFEAELPQHAKVEHVQELMTYYLEFGGMNSDLLELSYEPNELIITNVKVR